MGGLALVAATAGGTSAARLGSSQQIAYSDVDGNVYFGTAANGPATTIYQSDGSTTLASLAITPDGANVLALSNGTDVTQLALVPAGGGTVAGVAGTDGAQDGSISPDGKSVIFSLAPNGSDTLAAGIYSVPIAGGTPTALVTSPAGATDSLPQLSPDGTQVAFVRDTVDSSGNEVVALELQPVAGGALRQLATGVAAALFNGGRLSFSPDGKKIAYAGSFDNPGLFTVSVADGSVSQLSQEYDYWPVFTSDGSTIVFSRDAASPGADDNADTPVDPVDVDTDELWTMSADGTNPAVVAEGDFESLAVVPYLIKGSTGGRRRNGRRRWRNRRRRWRDGRRGNGRRRRYGWRYGRRRHDHEVGHGNPRRRARSALRGHVEGQGLRLEGHAQGRQEDPGRKGGRLQALAHVHAARRQGRRQRDGEVDDLELSPSRAAGCGPRARP